MLYYVIMSNMEVRYMIIFISVFCVLLIVLIIILFKIRKINQNISRLEKLCNYHKDERYTNKEYEWEYRSGEYIEKPALSPDPDVLHKMVISKPGESDPPDKK